MLTESPRKVVCFHLNQVGDLLFSLPALHNLRQHYPDAHIVSLARPNCKDLLMMSGLVDEVVERTNGLLPTGIRIARRLRKRKFDLLVLFSTSLEMRIMARICGAKATVGFVPAAGLCSLTKRVSWFAPPSTANNVRLVQAIGCPTIKSDYVDLVRPGDKERDEARQILRSAGLNIDSRFAVLSPGSSEGREVKCWTDEGFAAVAKRLQDQFGLQSVVIGLSGGETIRGLNGSVVDITGKTSLPALLAILEAADVFVGIDSGTMHLAASVRTPVVGIFGPSDPRATGPQGDGHCVVRAGLDCSPCLKDECESAACMREITPDQVLSAVNRCLSREAQGAASYA